jgi:hypothetical protein
LYKILSFSVSINPPKGTIPHTQWGVDVSFLFLDSFVTSFEASVRQLADCFLKYAGREAGMDNLNLLETIARRVKLVDKNHKKQK